MKLSPVFLLLLISACTRSAPPVTVPTITPTPGLWDLAALGQKPAVTWLDETAPVRSLRYESVPFDGHPTQVFAYYSDPDALQKRPPSGRKYPGVVLVHGGGGKAFAEWVELWAKAGYAALAMDLAGADGAGDPVPQPGPDQTDYFRFERLAEGPPANTWPYHAVASVIRAHSLLLHLPAVDPQRTALTGISWGGYLTCVVAGLDDRFKAAAPVYGCGYFDQCPRIFAGADRLSAEKKVEWLRWFDASQYVGRAKMPLLFVNGNTDSFFPVEPYQRTLQLLPEARRTVCLQPDLAHSHEAGWAPTEIRLFFEQVLNGATPLPTLARPQATGAAVSVGYAAIGPLRSAQFHYTTDSTSANEDRAWQRLDVPLTVNRLRASVPTGGFHYGFFVVIDARGASVSSEFLVRPPLGK